MKEARKCEKCGATSLREKRDPCMFCVSAAQQPVRAASPTSSPPVSPVVVPYTPGLTFTMSSPYMSATVPMMTGLPRRVSFW